MAGEPSFFELGVQDAERGRAFYAALFGWRMERAGSGFAINTPGLQGGIHGGDPAGSPYVFFRVDDIDAAIARVRELGGQVLDTDVEGDAASKQRFGRFKLCTDDQGSPLGLHQRPG